LLKKNKSRLALKPKVSPKQDILPLVLKCKHGSQQQIMPNQNELDFNLRGYNHEDL